jgi:cephalosporin hydroxylase
VLTEIASRHDTDKGPGYLDVYEAVLGPLRHQPITFLEIGIYRGGSLATWREYLTEATIVAVDIDPGCKRFEQEIPGVNVRIADQSDRAALEELAREFGPFHVIIDDGGHTMEQQIVSFEVLFKHLVPHGVYAVEDFGTSYFLEYGGAPLGGPGTAVDYFKGLVDSVNFGHAPLSATSHLGLCTVSEAEHSRLRSDIAGLQFFPHLAVAVKAG